MPDVIPDAVREAALYSSTRYPGPPEGSPTKKIWREGWSVVVGPGPGFALEAGSSPLHPFVAIVQGEIVGWAAGIFGDAAVHLIGGSTREDMRGRGSTARSCAPAGTQPKGAEPLP